MYSNYIVPKNEYLKHEFLATCKQGCQQVPVLSALWYFIPIKPTVFWRLVIIVYRAFLIKNSFTFIMSPFSNLILHKLRLKLYYLWHMDRNIVSLHTVLVFSISAIPVYMSSRIARRPVGPENWQYRYKSRIISIINIKLNTDPTYIIIFLPKLVLCSGVWFVHFTLSLFSFLKLVDSVKTKFVCNDYRLLFAGVESA